MMWVLILTHWVPLSAFLQPHLQNAILPHKGSAKIRVCKSFGIDKCMLKRDTRALSQSQLRLVQRTWAAVPDLEHLLLGPLLLQLQSNKGRLCDLYWSFQRNISVALCQRLLTGGHRSLLFDHQWASNFFSQQFKN